MKYTGSLKKGSLLRSGKRVSGPQHADGDETVASAEGCSEGTKVDCHLDGKLTLSYELPAPVSGKVGLWSKSDSVVYFDDFTVMAVK